MKRLAINFNLFIQNATPSKKIKRITAYPKYTFNTSADGNSTANHVIP
jgi:hypothetical protein